MDKIIFYSGPPGKKGKRPADAGNIVLEQSDSVTATPQGMLTDFVNANGLHNPDGGPARVSSTPIHDATPAALAFPPNLNDTVDSSLAYISTFDDEARSSGDLCETWQTNALEVDERAWWAASYDGPRMTSASTSDDRAVTHGNAQEEYTAVASVESLAAFRLSPRTEDVGGFDDDVPGEHQAGLKTDGVTDLLADSTPQVDIPARRSSDPPKISSLVSASSQFPTIATADRGRAILSRDTVCAQMDSRNALARNAMDVADDAPWRNYEQGFHRSDRRSNSSEDQSTPDYTNDAANDGNADDDSEPYIPRRWHRLQKQSSGSVPSCTAGSAAPGLSESVSTSSSSCRGEQVVAVVSDRFEDYCQRSNTFKFSGEDGPLTKLRGRYDSLHASDSPSVRADVVGGCLGGRGEHNILSSEISLVKPRHRPRKHLKKPREATVRTNRPTGPRSATPRSQHRDISTVSRTRARNDSALRKFHTSSPALQTDEAPKWDVDRIVKRVRRKGKIFYKVRWEDTWEPAESLRGCADTAIAEFLAKFK